MLLLALAAASLALYFYWNNRGLTGHVAVLKQNVESARAEAEALSKYRTIIDVEAHVSELRKRAEDDCAESRDLSSKIMKEATAEAAEILSIAKKEALEVEVKAHKEAKRVAGSAFDALQKADELKKVADAMRNVIEGYGDQYIIPTQSLLDELGEQYIHTDAGEKLKDARARTRKMIKANEAATCSYVEEYRKNTAIDFVVDAFNGKVDTIMASVKDDNFGTLEQKIKDAFQLVNINGKAFRDAQITPAYLENRLAELKWACTVQAIKEKDREEQKRIRDQIREEEKAVKEFERAMKEAQKEEDTLAKAMDKVRAELADAKDEQKAKYEAKLAEMQQKLMEAEEKNRRALSMAQQTKTGHVYVISNIGSFGEEVLKIGMTRRLDPMDRIWELGDASVPFDFDVHALIHSEDAPAMEKALHEKFADTKLNRVNPRKEFFRTSITEIKSELERMGIKAQWTIAAEAKEFRESVAIAKKATEKKSA